MESRAFDEILTEVTQVARAVRHRRSQHAVALWVVSDILTSLGDGLVPYEESEPLPDGSRLGVFRLPTPAPTPVALQTIGAVPGPGARWVLGTDDGEGARPAWEASPAVVAEILRGLPAFFESYLRHVQSAAGSRATVELAGGIVRLGFDLGASRREATAEA